MSAIRRYWLPAAAVALGLTLIACFVYLLLDFVTQVGTSSDQKVDRIAALASIAVGLAAVLAVVVAGRSAETAQRSVQRGERHRLTHFKAELFVELYVECARHRQHVADQDGWLNTPIEERGSEPPRLLPSEHAERAYLAVKMVTIPRATVPDMVLDSASLLWEKTRDLGSDFALFPDESGEWRSKRHHVEFKLRDAEWRAAADAFRGFAQLELEGAEFPAMEARLARMSPSSDQARAN